MFAVDMVTLSSTEGSGCPSPAKSQQEKPPVRAEFCNLESIKGFLGWGLQEIFYKIIIHTPGEELHNFHHIRKRVLNLKTS